MAPSAVRRSSVRRTVSMWLAGTFTAAESEDTPCRRARRWGCSGGGREDEGGIDGKRVE